MQHNKVKDSTILVTGGAGFIGSYVVEELIPLQPKKIIILDNFFMAVSRMRLSQAFLDL